MRTLFLSIILSIVLITNGKSQEFDVNDIGTKIEFTKKEDALYILSAMLNKTSLDLTVRFELQLSFSSLNGAKLDTIISNQVLIKQASTLELINMSVVFSEEDELTANLKIYLDDMLIASNQKSYVGLKKKNTYKQQIFSDGEGLSKIVIDQTKTKFGKDFYDFFYSKYNLTFNYMPEIVTIDEAPGMGRTTQIIVLLGNETVYEFNSSPNQEYLQQIANYCVQMIVQKMTRQQQLQNNN